MIVLILSLVALGGELEGVLAERWDRAREAEWRSPTRTEREVLGHAMAVLVRAAPDCREEAAAHAERLLAGIDHVLERLEDAPGTVWVVREGAERRGVGLFAVRCGPADPIVLQAPHSIHDLGTGALLRRLWVEGRARAAFWSTVHRYRATPDEAPEDEVHPADVCRQPGSGFHAATVGAAAGDPELRFVQLHGFGDGSAAVDLVVSSGDGSRPPEGLARALAPLGTVGTYGIDTWVLGGTRNVQGRALAEGGPGRFLHLELDKELRDALLEEPERRKLLSEALAAPWF